MSYQDLLAQYDSIYSGAKKADNSRLPDGKYKAIITSAELGHSQKGTFQITWKLSVCEGQHDRRLLPWKYSEISNDRIGYLKADLEAVGLVEISLSNLEQLLPTVVGTIMEVTLATSRTNDKYQNVYFGRKLGTGDVAPYLPKNTDVEVRREETSFTPAAPEGVTTNPLDDEGDLPF